MNRDSLREVVADRKRERRPVECSKCGETRGHAAHGLCERCYRRHERDRERQERSLQREHSYPVPGVQRSQKKLMTAYAQLLTVLQRMGVASADVTAIRRVIKPYLLPVAELMSLVDRKGARQRRSHEHSGD
jgi:hypothetical protein